LPTGHKKWAINCPLRPIGSTAYVHSTNVLRLTSSKEKADDAYDFDGDLRLKEVDVLGEVERVLATVADHVRVEDVVGAFEDAHEVCQVDGAL